LKNEVGRRTKGIQRRIKKGRELGERMGRSQRKVAKEAAEERSSRTREIM
jgi:hypothetical protein